MESLRGHSERYVLSTGDWTERRHAGHSSSPEWMGKQSWRYTEDSSRLMGQWLLDFGLYPSESGTYFPETVNAPSVFYDNKASLVHSRPMHLLVTTILLSFSMLINIDSLAFTKSPV